VSVNVIKHAAGTIVIVLLIAAVARAQPGAKPGAQPAQAAPPKDALGRDTPRGTLLGFMDAARKENDEIAPSYLQTTRRGKAATELARQLYVVLDKRLPARLAEVSDRPEGSLANPFKPGEDVIGTITTAHGSLDIVVERVKGGPAGHYWLFSRKTLEAIPDVYEEVDLVSVDRYLPDFLSKSHIAGIRLFEWLSLVVVVPLCYWVFGLLTLVFRPAFAIWRRRHASRDWLFTAVARPLRLLVLALVIRWVVSVLELPLLERRFWSIIQTSLATTAITWLLLLVNGLGERYVLRRFPSSKAGEIAPLVRVARRVGDVFVIVGGVLVMFYYFGFDPTAALAGLGIGGIAVALAAQKTLENVIGGLSITFDHAVRPGDFLKVGDALGTVDSVGLRSTRIRTLDRTILTVPNGQIANVNIETLSARDKFWFHHFVALRYETTSAQVRSVVEGVRQVLVDGPGVDPHFIRVRFFRLGPFSLDIEVSTYIVASNWERFLEIQQDLLLRIMEVVEEAGTAIALPSQTLQFADARATASVTGRGTGQMAARVRASS
jgi:MscS family membrane protein